MHSTFTDNLICFTDRLIDSLLITCALLSKKFNLK